MQTVKVGQAPVESIFEHNAEIKPGNSGGPLIGQMITKFMANFAIQRDKDMLN